MQNEVLTLHESLSLPNKRYMPPHERSLQTRFVQGFLQKQKVEVLLRCKGQRRQTRMRKPSKNPKCEHTVWGASGKSGYSLTQKVSFLISEVGIR